MMEGKRILTARQHIPFERFLVLSSMVDSMPSMLLEEFHSTNENPSFQGNQKEDFLISVIEFNQYCQMEWISRG